MTKVKKSHTIYKSHDGNGNMLIRFNVKNFLSFDDKENNKSEEFSMIAGKVRSKKEHVEDDGKIKLLKFAAVYGANASGKSNLVKAMDFMKHIVKSGLPSGYTDMYCKTDERNKLKPSYFEVEIKLNSKYFAYGFEVVLNKGEFLSEWLIELTADNKEKLVFSRDIKNRTYELGSCLKTKGLVDKLEVYAEDIQDDSNVLFLSVMNANKRNLYQKYKRAKILHDVYYWFVDCLDINYPDEPISSYSYMANNDNVEEVCNMIAAFGTGIIGFQMVDIPIDQVLSHIPKKEREELASNLEKRTVHMRENSKIAEFSVIMRSRRDFFIISVNRNEEATCKTIKFSHNRKNILFELAEESDGTVRILDLLEILLSSEGKVYVIDELDRCLHPSLTYKFVDTFLQLAEQKNIQLIVTTHESRLLDFDLLRRDEVWFVNKRRGGESDIYSLEEYNARFDQKIDKAYLEGRYGGVPVFSTVFPIKEA